MLGFQALLINQPKLCELIETATSISITCENVEDCHRLPSEQNDKTIIRFSRRKGAEMVLSKKQKNKKTDLRASIIAVLVLRLL